MTVNLIYCRSCRSWYEEEYLGDELIQSDYCKCKRPQIKVDWQKLKNLAKSIKEKNEKSSPKND